jgi:hypothetical protein
MIINHTRRHGPFTLWPLKAGPSVGLEARSRLDRIADREGRLLDATWEAGLPSVCCGLTERELRRFIRSSPKAPTSDRRGRRGQGHERPKVSR